MKFRYSLARIRCQLFVRQDRTERGLTDPGGRNTTAEVAMEQGGGTGHEHLEGHSADSCSRVQWSAASGGSWKAMVCGMFGHLRPKGLGTSTAQCPGGSKRSKTDVVPEASGRGG
eukprot:symbB.v1.2.024118.t1/scaffold2218.1/size85484/8